MKAKVVNMATDRKADHVGNNGGRYTDMDGMTKQFTYIDHDKKTTISANTGESYDKDWHKKYRAYLLQRITDLPASICPEPFQDYTLRGDNPNNVIKWDTEMLTDNGTPITRLRDLATLIENRAELMKLIQ